MSLTGKQKKPARGEIYDIGNYKLCDTNKRCVVKKQHRGGKQEHLSRSGSTNT